jgi:hypothetical protein
MNTKLKIVPKNDGLTQSRSGDELQPEEMTPTPCVKISDMQAPV